MSAAAAAPAGAPAGNETEAAAVLREAKPSTPRSILRRDVPASSTAAEGATRKRVTFEVSESLNFLWTINSASGGREDALLRRVQPPRVRCKRVEVGRRKIPPFSYCMPCLRSALKRSAFPCRLSNRTRQLGRVRLFFSMPTWEAAARSTTAKQPEACIAQSNSQTHVGSRTVPTRLLGCRLRNAHPREGVRT